MNYMELIVVGGLGFIVGFWFGVFFGREVFG